MPAKITCIYCGIQFDPTRGEGDHVFPVQLGEFRNDRRFRRICTSCNSNIGRSEQQFLSCGPESFFRDLVKPKVPRKRERGRSQVKACLGVPGPVSTIDHGDHRELVRRSKDNPTIVIPVDQIVLHDEKSDEYFIELFTGMNSKDLEDRVKKQGIRKLKKTWIHCDDKNWSEFQKLVEGWANSKIQNLPETEAGTMHVNGRIQFKVNDHYFRSLTKIALHYYLINSRRGFRGDEDCFEPVRNFIMNGGDIETFFNQPGSKFVMPFGKLPSGGVITPGQWCHIIAADETDKVAVVYIQLFVGNGCITQSHHITLATIDAKITIPNSTWGHVYLYDESPSKDRYTGQVEEIQPTRVR